jgi:hypothetical protein
MMKIIKVLGSERVYLMEDGSKRPFKLDILSEVDAPPVETVTIDEAIEVLEQKPKKKRKYKRKKKEL